ncbi:hypothetical protein P154DRAFT_528952 [Amniculicola lignicola CBS 123094]|uniref:Uncharacterized protein n=1 Tax=Amniculicola lignicola CBS 123094 TaxID=1392246 RepID=A0A6A5WZW5_9PLEO|nr:hypothetical protein P154DRAFT_528952 [Amniculicola lignicola CBS 123094]
MDYYKAVKDSTAGRFLASAANTGYHSIGKPLAKALHAEYDSWTGVRNSQKLGNGSYPLTEENLRILNASHEPLEFTSADLGDYTSPNLKPIPQPKNLHSLPFMQDELLNLSDIDTDSDANWSLKVAPPSKAMSDWALETSEDGSDSRSHEEVKSEERIKQGLTVGEIGRMFAGVMMGPGFIVSKDRGGSKKEIKKEH